MLFPLLWHLVLLFLAEFANTGRLNALLPSPRSVFLSYNARYTTMPWSWSYKCYILEGKKLCYRSLFFKSQKAELLILILVLWVIVVNWRCAFTVRSKRLHAFWFLIAGQTVSIKSLTMWPMQRRGRWHLPVGEGGIVVRRKRNVTRKDPSWKYKQWLLTDEVPELQNKKAAPQFPSRWESLNLPFVLVGRLQTPNNSLLNFGWLYWGSCSAVLFCFIF